MPKVKAPTAGILETVMKNPNPAKTKMTAKTFALFLPALFLLAGETRAFAYPMSCNTVIGPQGIAYLEQLSGSPTVGASVQKSLSAAKQDRQKIMAGDSKNPPKKPRKSMAACGGGMGYGTNGPTQVSHNVGTGTPVRETKTQERQALQDLRQYLGKNASYYQCVCGANPTTPSAAAAAAPAPVDNTPRSSADCAKLGAGYTYNGNGGCVAPPAIPQNSRTI